MVLRFLLSIMSEEQEMVFGDANVTVGDLRVRVAEFVREREWEAFHTLKNLSMALATEAGELMEPFLWLKPEEVELLLEHPLKRTEVEDELADVILYALAFANRAQIDVSQAIVCKMEKNALKYPIERARGRADKYNQLP